MTLYLGIPEENHRDIGISLLGGKIDTMKSTGSVIITAMPMNKSTTFKLSALTTSHVAGDLRGRKWSGVGGKFQVDMIIEVLLRFRKKCCYCG